MDNTNFYTLNKWMESISDVTIVGAGLNGLTLSLALERVGLKVTIIDNTDLKKKINNTSYDGRAYALAKASQNLFEALGLWSALSSYSQPIFDVRVTDGDKKNGPSNFHMHFNHKELGDDPLGYTVEDRYLKKTLINQVYNSKNITVLSESVVNVQTKNDMSYIFCETGNIIKSKVLMACDGKNSKIASDVGVSLTFKNYKQQALVTSVKHERNHKGIAYQFFMPTGPLAILPLRKNRSSIVWVLPTKNGLCNSKLNKKDFKQKLQPVFGSFLGEIELIGKRFSYPLSSIIADSFIKKRVVLIGDSAHSVHPIAGQGFNQGLRDIATIAEVITLAKRRGEDIGSSNVLERYENWRRFDSATLSKSTDLFNSLFSNDNSYLRLGRRLGMGAINNTPFLRKFFMREAAGLNGDQPRLLLGQKL